LSKKIAVGFNNGIGNYVIFTSVLEALSRIGYEIYIVMDEDWYGEIKDAVVAMIEKTPCVKKIIKYHSEYRSTDYDAIYMTRHSNAFGLYYDVYGTKPHLNSLENWHGSFISEMLLYYKELHEFFGYNGKIYPQFAPYDDDIYNKFKDDKIIAISNGYIKLDEKTFDRKAYSQWGEVIRRLEAMYPDYVKVLLGGASDIAWADQISEEHSFVVNLAGTTDILETAAYIKAAKLFLTTDTGMMHIGDALHTPMVVLFGPTLVSKNGPLNGSHVVLRSPLTCAPCQGTVLWAMCKSDHCTSVIDPSMVVAAARRFI
jgi:ADP-heptose:LPS heptosyltransferase